MNDLNMIDKEYGGLKFDSLENDRMKNDGPYYVANIMCSVLYSNSLTCIAVSAVCFTSITLSK